MSFRPQPLSSSLFLVSILGFLISVAYTMSGRLDMTWGFTFALFFLVLFVATLVSMEPVSD